MLKAHERGVRTKQFNPAGQAPHSLAVWMAAVMTVTGQAPQMDYQEAVQLIHATPAAGRSEFAKEIWRRARQHYPGCGRSQCAADQQRL